MMDTVDISPQFKSTSLAVPSPTASHIACLSGARLQVRCLTTFEIVRNIPLPTSLDIRNTRLAWSSPIAPTFRSSTSRPTSRPSSASTSPRRSSRTPLPRSNRILVNDDNSTRVYDLRDEKWSAVISNGSGGMGRNVHVEFGVDEDEVLVWSDFTASVKVWCLKMGRAVEIRDPKYVGRDGRGWGYRSSNEVRVGRVSPEGDVFTLLCRPSGTDTLLLLAPRTYTFLNRVELPTTDAGGMKWSRDGRWLSIWDAASAGYKLHIYTADGNLYRTITREPSDEASEGGLEGLGIKSIEWVPGNEHLAVGGWDRRVRILSTRTFSPVVFLDHTAIIDIPSAPVYVEHIDGKGNRSYVLAPQPITPPKAVLEKNETGLMKQGISVLAFNSDGTLCATRDDSTPSTVWIWDLTSLRPRMILIQYTPVKSLQWHPSDVSQLLIQTTHNEPTIYIYTASTFSTSSSSSTSPSPPPEILTLSPNISKPASTLPAKWILSWLSTPQDKKPAFFFGYQQGYILVWPDGKDQILRFEHEDEEQSDDSLYDILTGRTPVPRLGRREVDVDEGRGDEMDVDLGAEVYDSVGSGNGLDDTFREQRWRTNGMRGRSGLDESGLDEMF